MPSRIVLGVGGGIAAYKIADLCRKLIESGHDVRVIPTRSALNFVGAATWAALSHQPVSTEVWDSVDEVPHVRIGQNADLVVVAPATADLLAKAATGLADDLLTATLLTARCPVVFVPAMHTEMWEHPATQANVSTLRERGAMVVEPAVGRLTGVDTGKGRLPEPVEIAATVEHLLRRSESKPDLLGRHVLITAGGTREYLDPVRFLGNRSSGRQGFALAQTAASRGATVTLVAANTALPTPAGVEVVPVVSAMQMRETVIGLAGSADVVVMAAAVADFRPVTVTETKIKKPADGGAPTIELVQNPDILAELSAHRARPDQVVVGFAAETGDDAGSVLDHGRAKLARKGCDLLVVNEVGVGKAFEVAENAAVILDSAGGTTEVPYGPKEALADVIWDLVVRRFSPDSGLSPS